MNKYLFILLLALGVGSSSLAQFSKATLQASGLTCALCAKSIYTNLSALPFVKEVDTDLNASAFVIVFKEGADVDPDLLAKKVEEAGFSVASLKFNTSNPLKQIKNDAHLTVNGKVFHFVNMKNSSVPAGAELRLIDQHFVSAKEFKKFTALTKMECIKAGKAQACCIADGIVQGTRIFHMTM